MNYAIFEQTIESEKVNNKILWQLLLRGLLASPIIAILVCAPIYLVKTNPQKTFFKLWFSLTLATLITWGLY